MATMKGLSPAPIEFASRRRTTKVVRKWSEEQTDLFATVLSLRRSKDGGDESSWAEELENLAMKKSSNEKLFREIQASLEEELVKIDQSIRDHDEEATFSVPQLRAKYKWLKREWKIIQSKISYALLTKEEEMKIPRWHKLLDPVFSVFQSSNREEHINDRPSMVNENGLLHNGEPSTDGISDCYTLATEESRGESCVESSSKNITSALNRPESFEMDQEEERTTHSTISNTHNGVLNSETARIPPITIVRVPNAVNSRSEDTTSQGQPRKTRKRALESNDRNNTECFPLGNNSSQSGGRSDSDRYVEIIKYLLDAEERREQMFVAFQKEQAEANREHELKMAQFFTQSLSQQQSLSNGISQILQALSKMTDP